MPFEKENHVKTNKLNGLNPCSKETINIFLNFVKVVTGAVLPSYTFMCKDDNIFILNIRSRVKAEVEKMISENRVRLVGVYAGKVEKKTFYPSLHLAYTINYLLPFNFIEKSSVKVTDEGMILFVSEKIVPREFFSIGRRNRYNTYIVMHNSTNITLGWGYLKDSNLLMPLKTPSILMRT